MRRSLLAMVLLMLVAESAPAGTVDAVVLHEGRKVDNTLRSPVIVASTPLGIEPIVQEFSGRQLLYRAKSGAVIGGKAKTSPNLDLGALLTEALRNEAPPMGFELGDGGWKVGGALKAIYYDLRSNGWAMFYYGTIVVDLEVVSPEGETFSTVLQLYNYDPEYSKAPRKAIAEMLVEGAQEILARLNVRYFKFPADPSVEKIMAEISERPDGVSDMDLECTGIGLSGSSEVVMSFLEVLKRTKDENDRSEIVDALARLEDSRVIPVLEERYASEDEDVRWFILKAMGYLGSEEAMELVKNWGLEDKNKACRALAQDVLDPSMLVQPTKAKKKR